MARHSRQAPRRDARRTSRAARPRRRLGWPVIAVGVGAVAAMVGAVIALSLLGSDEDGGDTLAQQVAASRSDLAGSEIDGLTLGDADAPLEVLVFEDFQCPFCVRFTGEVEPTIVDEYVKTGKVKLTFQNYPVLGPESQTAALGSVCAAEQGDAWSYGLRLFEIQAQAGQASNEKLNVGRFDTDALVSAAGESGLDRTAFAACLQSPGAVEELQEQFARAQAMGVKGTPSFAIDGALVRPADIQQWRATLDAALQRLAAAR